MEESNVFFFRVILEGNKNIPREEIERQKAEILNWEASINQTEKIINYSSNVYIFYLKFSKN